MKNKKSILTVCILLLIYAVMITALSGCASANNEQGRRGGGERREKPVFSDMDINNDGYINKDEFKGPSNLFTKIDENGDSLITEEEFSNMPEPPSGGRPQGRP